MPFVLEGCAVSFGILFLSLFRGSTSSYQWRCSALDTENNKYYLPDFGGRTQAMGYTWEESVAGVSYIYEVDYDELNCSGTVTAVEFCYDPPQGNSRNNREVFTLLTLSRQNDGLNVTNSIPISFHPGSPECMLSKCCDITTLTEQNQFNLPSPNFFLGMTTKQSPNLGGTHSSEYSKFQTQSSYQLAAGQPVVNSILTLNEVTMLSLRLVWLHITPFPTTTTTSMQQSISSFVPETAVSSSDDSTIATNALTSEPPSTSTGRSNAPDVTTSYDIAPEVITSYDMAPDVTIIPDVTTSYNIAPEVTTSYDKAPDVTIIPDVTTSYDIAPDVTTSYDKASDVTTSYVIAPEVTTSYDMTTANLPPRTTANRPSTYTEGTLSDTVSSNTIVRSGTPAFMQSSISPLTKSTVPLSSAKGELGESAGNSNNSAVGAIVGGVVVIVLIIIAVLLVLIMLILYRRKKYHSSKRVGPTAIDNIIYNNKGIESTEAVVDLTLNNPEYDYSEVGPSTTANVKGSALTKQEDLYYSSVLSEDNLIPQYEDVENQTKDLSLQQNYSDYDDIYTVPANNVVGLYEQLENMMTDDVTRHNVVLGDLLGSGQFGDVYKGIWQRRLDNLDVAVKTLKEGSSEDDKVKFLQEAAIMAQFRHPNVVTMYGVVKDGEPVLLVLEMLKKGDLRNYLLSMKTDDGGVSSEIDGHELLSYCRQVVSGMVYLSNKAFVHRDLAARNILVSDDRICKIADFGMSRDLEDENYYVSQGGKIPVKWTAPEALFYKKYSTASDVWSFGAVMYEIWSIGCKPFQNMQNAKVIKTINSGYRLPPPPGCPRAIYSIMMSCWHPKANARPDFNELSTKLSVSNSKLLHKDEADTFSGATLGADVSLGEGMYENMQKMYIIQP